MKATASKTDLKKAMAILKRSLPGRTPLRILDGLLIQPVEGGLELATTNLDIAFVVTIPAEVDCLTPVLIPGRSFASLIDQLPGKSVVIERDFDLLKVSDGVYSSSMGTMTIEDYPQIPEVPSKSPGVPVDVRYLADAISCVAFAAAKDDTRPILMCVSLESGDGALALVASDGFRLAAKTIPVGVGEGLPQRCLVPSSSLSAIGSSLPSRGSIWLSAANAIFHAQAPGMRATARVSEGSYPNWSQVVPSEEWGRSRATVTRADLLDAAKLAKSLGARIRLEMVSYQANGSPNGSAVLVKIHGNEASPVDRVIQAGVSLNNIKIGEYVASQLVDALGACDGKLVELMLGPNQTSPLVITPTESKRTIHLVMPAL